MNRASFILLMLCSCLTVSPVLAASPHPAPDQNATGLDYDAHSGEFTRPVPPTGGWPAFAKLLEKVTPSVNTQIPLTASQVTTHIAQLIDSGKPQAALTLIQERAEARKKSGEIGTDVQLEYQRGRALDALGEHDQAAAVWRQMTTDFPELPEPWNALAIEYARRGSLQQAQDALNMALVSVPNFAPALENLGRVQLALAQQSFARARAAGAPAAAPAKAASRAVAPARDTPHQPAAQ